MGGVGGVGEGQQIAVRAEQIVALRDAVRAPASLFEDLGKQLAFRVIQGAVDPAVSIIAITDIVGKQKLDFALFARPCRHAYPILAMIRLAASMSFSA